MSERFQRVFTGKTDLYAEGSPVLIAAHALLHDTQTGRVLAQMKLRNIQDKRIKAVTVRLAPFGVAGDALGGEEAFQYLDLAAARGAEFGAKTPIYLPNAVTRAVQPRVTQVVFEGGEVWSETGAEWAPLTPPVPLKTALGDYELEKEFRLAYGEDSVNEYTETRDLWYCTCGALNHKGEAACYRCKKKPEKTDLAALKASCEKRLAEEKAEKERRAAEAKRIAEEKATEAKRRAEKRAAAAKKFKKVIGITGAVAAVCLVSVLIVTKIAEQKHLAELRVAEEKRIAELSTKIAEAAIASRSVAAGDYHTVGLKADGTVVAVGNGSRQCDVSEWTDIIAVSAGSWHTVGLRKDGTVVAVGANGSGKCDVSDWTDIVAVAAGYNHTVGLRADGTAVAVGENENGQCDVSDWTDVVAVAAGYNHTVGLRADGTVVAVGDSYSGKCDVSEWTDIIAVAAGSWHTVGLRKDGTVVAVGANGSGQCDVSDWTDIVAVAAGYNHTVGLRADGTAVAVGNGSGQCNVSDWTDVVAVAAGYNQTVGLKADGTVVAVGDSYSGKCDVSEWNNLRVK